MSPLRVAHFSDLHVCEDPRRLGPSEMLGKLLAGWVNLRVLRRYGRFTAAETIGHAAMRDIEALDPDLVVFSGDATGLGLWREFERARVVLEPLLARARAGRAVGLPGNHDNYEPVGTRERRFSQVLGALEGSDLPEHAVTSSGYPKVRLFGERLAVVLADAALPRLFFDSSGALGEAQLAALDRALGDPRLAGRRVLLVCHYGPRRHDRTPDTARHGLRDADALLRLAERHRVAGILHGHLHRRFALAPGADARVPLLCAGSITDGRRAQAYHVYELQDEAIDLRVRRFDRATGTFADDPALVARIPYTAERAS